jgi:hypothetical protein
LNQVSVSLSVTIQVLTILLVTRALCYLHQASPRTGAPLVYGGLRASNIFVCLDGTIKLGTNPALNELKGTETL